MLLACQLLGYYGTVRLLVSRIKKYIHILIIYYRYYQCDLLLN